MSFKVDPAERKATEVLIRDFGSKPDLTVEEVYKVSWNRFNAIEGSHRKVKILHQLLHDDEFRYNYRNLPREMHLYMYEDLFTFAGKYRSINDPLKGQIYFGPQHAHQRKPQFSGNLPAEIEPGVLEAIQYLKSKAAKEDPVLAAVRFYQKFVKVHPFYDGNGRIARLIANTYLAGFELTILWSEFDSKRKFIHKLNYCHKNPSTHTFQLLRDYINDYTFRFEDLDSPE